MTASGDDFVEFLSQQARSGISVAHEFKLRYVEGQALHLFFEGEEDPSYYLPEIRRRSNKEIWSYICDGKPNVRILRQILVDDGYLGSDCLFFVDRDFDDFFGTQIADDDRTFITVPYSVENYLVSLQIAEEMMIDLVGMERSDPQFLLISRKLPVLLDQFAKLLRPALALCLAYRATGGRPNLNNACMSKVFRVGDDLSLDLRKDGYSLFKKSVFPPDCKISFGAVRCWIRKLEVSKRQLWLRGKFELWAFQQILFHFIQAEAARRKAKKQRGITVPVALQSGSMFELLSGRVRICPVLDEFLGVALQKAA